MEAIQRGTVLEEAKVRGAKWQLATNSYYHGDSTEAGKAWRTGCDLVTMESWPNMVRQASQDERGLFGEMDQKMAGHHRTLMAYQVNTSQNI